MVVDPSALLAILLEEPEAQRCADALEAAAAAFISAASRVKLDIVIIDKLGDEALADVDALIEEAGIQVEPLTGTHWMLARQAYLTFGTGVGR